MQLKGKKRIAALATAFAVTGGLVITGIAGANLTGSSFESTDANMIVNGGAGAHDWANAPHLHVGQDLPTGGADNSFGQGTSENDINVTVTNGSIPNSKADLGLFADSTETLANGDVMLYLAWTRNNDSGTTNFDFELNKAAQPNLTTPGAKTLVRTAGDLLINYGIQGGSQTPSLSRRVWTGSVWGPEVAFNSTVADGSFNQNTAVANTLTASPANIPAARFGEAAINMTAANIIPNQNDPNAPCTGFGSAYVKSRSSTSFSSEIKDFIAPIAVDLNTCGSIKVVKVTDPASDTTTSFSYTASYTAPFNLKNGENKLVGQIKAGSGYSVSEGSTPGWTLTSAVCDNGTPANIVVVAGQTTTCTFTNQARGTIIVRKITDPTGASKSFDFTASYNASGFSLTDGQSNNSGLLLPGTYSVSENSAGPEWTPLGSSCSDGSLVSAISLQPGETVTCTFTNQQLGHIIVHKAIQGPADTTTSFDFTSNYGSGFSLNSTQTNNSGPLVTGTYNVAETAKAHWALVGTSCSDGSPVSAIALAPGETVNCIFTNQLQVGSITIHKTHLNKAAGGTVPEANVSFVVTGPSGTFNATTDANGNICLDGLFFGAYTVHENVPAGEQVDANDKVVNVDNVAYCGDNLGETVSFVNTPLTDIHVQVHSQFPGGTRSTIVCDTPVNSGPPAGDASADSLNLVPGTYHCTVVIDP
jgi:hypothetical protein